MKASVLVSIYNKVEFVKKTLFGLSHQSEKDFEVIICDDGSTEETRGQIKNYLEELKLRYNYVWYKDVGFQKTIVLNKGVLASTSDYLIFLDGDCIPHKDFVKYHCILREPGKYLGGRRVFLKECFSQQINLHTSLSKQISFLKLIHNCTRWEEGIILPDFIRQRISVNGIKGCNWSCWKKDLVEINGFYNDCLGPVGGEDCHIHDRFTKKGLKLKSARYGAIVYHQYHEKIAPNYNQERKYIPEEIVYQIMCDNGLEQIDNYQVTTQVV
ncbi:MAG: glycosyltransferase [bacterium]